MPKVIHYYRKVQYGCEREFIAPSCEADARIIRQLTGSKTISGVIRELIHDLSGGQITFLEVIAP